MERTDQDADGRFEGGIFSGQGTGARENTANWNGARGRNNPQGQQEYYSYQGNRSPYYRVPPYNAPYDNAYYANRGQCPYGCQGCPNRKQSNQTALLIVAVMAMGMLFVAFLVTMVFLVSVVSRQSAMPERNGIAIPYGELTPTMPFSPDEPEISIPVPDWSGKASETEAETHGEYYGEIKDAVRTDLSYSIEWENYECEDNSDTVMIAVDYPVITGDVPNMELLNNTLAGEIEYFEEYYEEYSKYMLPEEIFAVYSEGYVTYMDEDVMSVVFNEIIYTDYWVDCGLYCVNIDMENGVVLDNGSILKVDDEFAIDFRMRSKEQNGDISALEYLTDQEVAYYLTNASTGIIFYTPLGMEIGLNYGEDYVTVTYKDYEEFLLKY